MTSSLRALDRQLLFVHRLVVDEGDDVRTRQEAMRILRDIEESLGRWAASTPSRAFAARLLRVRSELRSHLAATATLEDIGRPSRSVAGMLKRTVDTTRVGLRAVVSAEHPAGHAGATVRP
jgi:hypothetical protein